MTPKFIKKVVSEESKLAAKKAAKELAYKIALGIVATVVVTLASNAILTQLEPKIEDPEELV